MQASLSPGLSLRRSPQAHGFISINIRSADNDARSISIGARELSAAPKRRIHWFNGRSLTVKTLLVTPAQRFVHRMR